jgi:hypothetical protein
MNTGLPIFDARRPTADMRNGETSYEKEKGNAREKLALPERWDRAREGPVAYGF